MELGFYQGLTPKTKDCSKTASYGNAGGALHSSKGLHYTGDGVIENPSCRAVHSLHSSTEPPYPSQV